MVNCKIQSVFLVLLFAGNILVSVADAGPAAPSAVNTIREESATLLRQHKLSPHRIVGGQEVLPGSVPHQISLRRGGKHECGGSIINEDWIITAAHCVYNYPVSFLSVATGVHNLDNPERISQVRQVTATIVNENYEPCTEYNDIALLKLSKPLILGVEYRAEAIELATYCVEAGTLANVTGWGATSEGGPSSPVLLSVTVPIVSDESCRNDYRNQFEILDSMICAGFDQGEKDSCQRDSGGPLVVESEGKTLLAGIVSWGAGCARPKKPGVYTEVKYFVDWVKSKMN